MIVYEKDFGRCKWNEAFSIDEINNNSEYKDWYLPSKFEWYELYKSKEFISGFNFFSEYWINEEVNIHYALTFSLNKGMDFLRYKMSEYSVRLIRAF